MSVTVDLRIRFLRSFNLPECAKVENQNIFLVRVREDNYFSGQQH